MATSTGNFVRKIFQFQASILQRPSSVWQHACPASSCTVLRHQSNQSGGSKPTKTTPNKETPAKPASTAPTSTTDGTTYEAPEYYAHKTMSFYEIESDMLKYRQTQPDPSKPVV